MVSLLPLFNTVELPSRVTITEPLFVHVLCRSRPVVRARLLHARFPLIQLLSSVSCQSTCVFHLLSFVSFYFFIALLNQSARLSHVFCCRVLFCSQLGRFMCPRPPTHHHRSTPPTRVHGRPHLSRRASSSTSGSAAGTAARTLACLHVGVVDSVRLSGAVALPTYYLRSLLPSRGSRYTHLRGLRDPFPPSSTPSGNPLPLHAARSRIFLIVRSRATVSRPRCEKAGGEGGGLRTSGGSHRYCATRRQRVKKWANVATTALAWGGLATDSGRLWPRPGWRAASAEAHWLGFETVRAEIAVACRVQRPPLEQVARATRASVGVFCGTSVPSSLLFPEWLE